MKGVLALICGGFVAMSLCARNSSAQATWGAISGFVNDASGAAIAGASVTVTEVKTGVVTKGSTDTSGLYNVTHLLPGEYRVSVEAQGFKRFTQEHVTLQVDSTVRVDCVLQLGAVSQEVTVTAATPQLKTEKTDVSRDLNQQTVEALPVVAHNLTKLFDLVPGAIENFLQIGEGETPSGATSITVNGMWFGANDYLIDGITDLACCFSNQIVFAPNQDSVSEVKMSASNYDPEFGNSAGLIAQYVTKSGTNEIHGSAWWTNMNKATFAANPFTEKIAGTGPNGKGLGPAPFNQNQGAFSLGGPIKKNKMFIFGDYQLLRREETDAITATVPVAAWRAGDFSGLAKTNPIFDPNTGNADGSGRTQFACGGVANVICPDRISTVATNLVNLLPLPNIGQDSANPYDVNYVGSGKTSFRTDQFDVRWDYNITDKDKIFIRNTYMYSDLLTPGLFGTVAGGPPTGGLAAEAVPTHNDQLAINYTRTFSGNLLAEFRGGLLRWHLQGYTPDANLETNNTVGISGLNLGGPITGGLAGFTIGGPFGSFIEGPGPNNVALPRLDIIDVFQFVNNWTMMHGNHQLRWGVDIHRNMEDLFTVNAHTSGYFDFNQLTSASPSVANSGLGAASFMLGLPDQFQRGVFVFIPHERQWRNALYIQDVWRVSPKLTANYGLRWDYFGPDTTPLKAGLSNFDPATGDVNLANLGGISSSTNVDGYHKGWAPRIGLAYKLTNKTVIRAGLGRSYFATNYSSTFQQLSIVFPISGAQVVSQPNIYTPVFPLDQGFVPPAAPFSAPASGHLKVPDGASVYYNPPYTPTEHVDQWNFTVERQLTNNFNLSLGYVGTKGSDLAWDPNLNAANVDPTNSTSILSRRPYYVLYGLSQGIGVRNNGANSSYNALQFVVDKRFSQGYSITSNFTWSKALDTEVAGFAWGDQGTNPYDREGSYGVGTNQDRAAVWTLSHNWQLPYGPGMHWGSDATGIKKWVLGGWQFNGVTVLEDGFALSPGLASGATLNADWGQRPDRIAGVPLYPSNKSTSEWFNPAAFEAPQFPGQSVQCCRWGNAARGSFRGPGLFGTDWALWKDFKFGSPLNREDTHVQIRWENFNALNHAPLGEPDTTVDDATAGRITSLQGTFLKANSTTMRRMMFTLRLQF
ncbi:MAG TPA: carboxypeptidase regulatory-like domain-containing protein [Terriglobia bacterium]|nr:carboxypeptidase regulatory-like domain-containing protein [Terriglobia bacterium]